jgi:predicted nuclease with TOPRIM domain
MSEASSESEQIAQELSRVGQRLETLERRIDEVEKVNARLEQAALTTARAMQEISSHWDAVYEAMRREEGGRPDPDAHRDARDQGMTTD